jgi:hypothetical protein
VNERERFRRLMAGEPVDRPPLLEEGVRAGVLERWHREGLPRGTTHLDMFGLTPHERVGPDLTFRPRYFGRIVDLPLREYRRAFDVSRRRFPRDWIAVAQRLHVREHLTCIWASRGLLQALGVGDWPTLEQALLATRERPEHVRALLEHYGDFCARMLELALEDVDPEFIYLSEPISDNAGPLLSPAMFEELMLPVYRKIVTVAQRHGCTNVLVSTYGNTSRLFPAMIDAGVSMIWLSEAPDVPELDYRELRQRFGPLLGLIGGIPLAVLRERSLERLAERVREIVPPLLSEGRYIPLASGRVRDDVPWDTYRHYRELLAALLHADAVSGATETPGPA